MRSLSLFTLSAGAIVLGGALAGCGGAGTSSATVPSTQPASSAATVPMREGTTYGVSALLHRAGSTHRAWMSPEAKSGKNLLYVSSYNEGYVDIYKSKGSNQSPMGTITSGLNGPEGMAVDKKLNLYVTNTGNNTVTVYAPGSLTPSATYSSGLSEPAGVTVGNDGTVYVSNLDNSVVEYPPGKMTPSITISINFPIAVALDPSNNLYISYLGGVEEVPPGSSTGTNLGITLDAPGGIAIDKQDDIVVADQTLPGVKVYPQGSTQPSSTFATVDDPNPIAFNKKASQLFIGDPTHNVVQVYSYPGETLVNTITTGVNFDAGVAVSPESKY
jgi:hypothetical protein